MAQINKPDDYFNTVLYTGDNTSSRDITGVGFQPDFTWIKQRSGVFSHVLGNSVSGDNKFLSSNGTGAEGTDSSKFRTFVSDGFQVGSHASVNNTSDTYVGWSWLGGGTASSNTDGSITSTVSANTTNGFSIVSYTGNGSSGSTVGHGLGVAPKMTIIKQRNSSNGWNVWHYGNNNGDPDSFGELNGSAAWYQNQGASGPYTTQPTSSLLTLTAYGQVNGNTNTYIAYCFAEKKGFSKFGSYTGNGNADGTFIYTGFSPSFVMLKRTNTTGSWTMYDNKRHTYNPNGEYLLANSSGASVDFDNVDFLSNGFKLRDASFNNGSGDTIIYMCFAESPFVTSTGIPTTAR